MEPGRTVAETFAEWAAGAEAGDIPDDARAVAENALLDVAGLCVASRLRLAHRAIEAPDSFQLITSPEGISSPLA